MVCQWWQPWTGVLYRIAGPWRDCMGASGSSRHLTLRAAARSTFWISPASARWTGARRRGFVIRDSNARDLWVRATPALLAWVLMVAAAPDMTRPAPCSPRSARFIWRSRFRGKTCAGGAIRRRIPRLPAARAWRMLPFTIEIEIVNPDCREPAETGILLRTRWTCEGISNFRWHVLQRACRLRGSCSRAVSRTLRGRASSAPAAAGLSGPPDSTSPGTRPVPALVQ